MSIPLPGRTLPPVPGTFRALRHRDFMWLWLGQVVSLTGSWMQSVAQGWLVLRLSDSVFLLGVVGFCNYLPFLLFGLLGGVAADRLPRRKALLATQALAMGLALVLALVTWFEMVRVWHLAVLAFGLGVVTAFDIPIRQSFLQELVGREDLQNAIALNSMAFNGARMVGPAAAGIVVATWGEATCFLVNALTFTAVLSSLAIIGTEGHAERGSSGSWLEEIREVLRYSWTTRQARAILLLVMVSSVFGMPYTILMPAFARDVLEAGAQELGFLMAASGVGALLGALLLARRRSTRHSGRIVAGTMTLFGAGLIVFALTRTFWMAAVCLVVVGAAMLIQLGSSNAFLQLLAPSGLRGRIVSLYMMSFIGMAPIGSLASGALARWLGVSFAVGLGGFACLLAATVFTSRIPALRVAQRSSDAEPH